MAEAPDSASLIGAGASVPDAATAPAATADASPAIELASDGGFAALLSGAVPAASLLEVATDRGERLDRRLRERLTTREVEDDPSSLGGPATEGVVKIERLASSSPMDDAIRVVTMTRPHARACYNNGLESDPNMSGKLVITVKVDATGQVSDATVVSNSGLSPGVAACVVRAYKNVEFAPPAGGAGATLTIPLVFALSN